MSVLSFLRRFSGRPAGGPRPEAAAPRPARDPRADDAARTLRTMSRQIRELRGLLQQQASLTMEALERTGGRGEEPPAGRPGVHDALRAAGGTGDVLVGPWTGEVGFELLYWIPYLGWLVEQGLDPRRMVVLSRGGAAPWYAHLTSRYVDILDLVGPDEFRTRTAGPKKQTESGSAFDAELLEAARRAAGLSDSVAVVHPSAMYRLFSALWRKRASVDLVESFTAFAPLAAPPPLEAGGLPAGLPPDYLVAKFYFSKAFPETKDNRAFVADLVRRVSARAPVLLLSTAVRLDEHSDFRTSSGSGVFVLDAHAVPQRNLEVQTRAISGSRGFIGTYGGFSYLAPFYGVRSLSFFSRRIGFERHHLDLANRVFDRLLPGGFLALDYRAIDLVSPAVDAWMTGPRASVPVPSDREDAPESADVLT